MPAEVYAELPELRGVVLRQGVAAVDSADDWWVSGGVTIAAGVWGDIAGARWVSADPQAFHIDTTDCSDVFAFPEPGEYQLVFASDDFSVDQTPPFTASQIDDFNVILTSVFGEPIVPVRQPEREVALLEEVIAAVDNREVSALIGPRVIAVASEHLAVVTVPESLAANEPVAPPATATPVPISLPGDPAPDAIAPDDGASAEIAADDSSDSGSWLWLLVTPIAGLVVLVLVVGLRRRRNPS